MGLKENCQSLFGTDNLYEVLSVINTASESELKKAYKKASLIVHPDRVDGPQKEAATRKFQILAQVYSCLIDKDKRAAYDETGCIDDENVFSEGKDWSSYFRLIFPTLTMKDIDDYLEKYKGSEEEIADLKETYLKYNGDMDKISEALIGYSFEEEDKYKNILNELIEKEEIPAFPMFVNERRAKRLARKNRFQEEAGEAAELRKEMRLDDSVDSLEAALMKRSRARATQFDDMIKNLEDKYAKKPRSKKKK